MSNSAADDFVAAMTADPVVVELNFALECDVPGGCPCTYYDDDPYPDDAFICSQDQTQGFHCWIDQCEPGECEREQDYAMLGAYGTCLEAWGWYCSYSAEGQEGCRKMGAGYVNEANVDFSQGWFTECQMVGICPSGASILGCYTGPEWVPVDEMDTWGWDEGARWMSINDNQYCLSEPAFKPYDCPGADGGPADPCALFAPEEEPPLGGPTCEDLVQATRDSRAEWPANESPCLQDCVAALADCYSASNCDMSPSGPCYSPYLTCGGKCDL